MLLRGCGRLPPAWRYTFEALDRLAAAASDLDAAKAVQRARDELFRAVGQARNSAA